jgi:hypothetical protein
MRKEITSSTRRLKKDHQRDCGKRDATHAEKGMDYLVHRLGENITASWPANDRINADESHLISSTKTPIERTLAIVISYPLLSSPRQSQSLSRTRIPHAVTNDGPVYIEEQRGWRQ